MPSCSPSTPRASSTAADDDKPRRRTRLGHSDSSAVGPDALGPRDACFLDRLLTLTSSAATDEPGHGERDKSGTAMRPRRSQVTRPFSPSGSATLNLEAIMATLHLQRTSASTTGEEPPAPVRVMLPASTAHRLAGFVSRAGAGVSPASVFLTAFVASLGDMRRRWESESAGRAIGGGGCHCSRW